MPNNLYITATEERSGKSVVVLGIMQMLKKELHRVAFFRPIISDPPTKQEDPDIRLVTGYFNLQISYEDTYGCTLKDAYQLINTGREDDLHDLILKKYKKLEDTYDFVLIEGTDFRGSDTSFELDINSDIAANLGAPVILISSGRRKSAEEMIRQVQASIDMHHEKGLTLVASIINRAPEGITAELVSEIRKQVHPEEGLPFYVMPENSDLANPTIGDVKRWLNASVMYGASGMSAKIGEYIVAAMRVEHFLEYIKPGCLVITPGDRSDIILA